jgi:hypothetical protein
MRAAERRIPELAAKAGHAAYKQALAKTGAVVVKTSEGVLVKRKADGTSTVIKALRPGKRVKVGLVLRRAKQEVAACDQEGHPAAAQGSGRPQWFGQKHHQGRAETGVDRRLRECR